MHRFLRLNHYLVLGEQEPPSGILFSKNRLQNTRTEQSARFNWGGEASVVAGRFRSMENAIRLSIEGMPAHEALGAVALSLWRNHLAHCTSHASGAVQKRRNITHAVVSGARLASEIPHEFKRKH
jgi:hypothetical protein